MLMLIGLLLAAAVVVAFVAFSMGAEAKTRLADALAQLAAVRRDLDEKAKHEAHARAELSEVKQALRAEKDALKALKKKAYEAKSAPATPYVAPIAAAIAPSPVPQVDDPKDELLEQVRELDRRYHVQSEQFAKAEAALKQAQNDTKALQAKLELSEKAKGEIASLRQALDGEKQRVGAEANLLLEMRRKVEWYRRIHLVQKSEIQIEKDRAAHVRQRFIEIAMALVRATQQPLSAGLQAELDRIKREEAAYQSVQEKQSVAELH